MPAPEGNQFAAKPAKAKLNCRKVVMGTPDEVRVWNRAQVRSGKKWSEWSRDALNEAGTAADGAAVRSSDLLGFPPVIDVCCGSRMFWFDRKTPQAIFVDKRTENHVLCDGRKLEIAPDVQADFTDLPFPDATFYLVVFDPPHMTTLGANSWMAKKYGRLTGDWKPMLKAGFEECFRVLKPNGTLVFKWNETDVKLKEVLELSPIPPLFGHTTGRQAKTVWATFLKPNA